MANEFKVSDDVAQEFFRLYKNNLVLPKLCNRQFDKYYGKPGHKIGKNGLSVKRPLKFTTRGNTLTYTPQDVLQDELDVVQGVRDGVDFEFTRDEWLFNADDIMSTYVAPAARTLASIVDNYGYVELVKKTANFRGTPGTPPSGVSDITNVTERIMEAACPDLSACNAVFSPLSNGRMIAGLSTLMNPQQKIGDQYIKGAFNGGILGISSLVVSQSVSTHTAGAGPGGTPLVNDTMAAGDTTVDIDGGSGSVTNAYRVGDVLEFAACYDVNPITKVQLPYLKQVVVQANASTTTGAVTGVSFLPALYATTARKNCSALPADNAAVTVVSGTASALYRQNVVFHPDALIFATAELPKPGGVHAASSITEDGYSMAFTAQYDINTDLLKCRTDIVYGWTGAMTEWACRRTE